MPTVCRARCFNSVAHWARDILRSTSCWNGKILAYKLQSVLLAGDHILYCIHSLPVGEYALGHIITLTADNCVVQLVLVWRVVRLPLSSPLPRRLKASR